MLAFATGSVACGGDSDGLHPGTIVDTGDDDNGDDDNGDDATGGDGVTGPDGEMTPTGAVAEAGCGCSSSRSLQALSCASSDGLPVSGSNGLELAPSGDIALFTLCYSPDGEFPVDHCRAFRWTRTGGSEALVDAGYDIGLADDGSALVVVTQDEDPRETLLLVGRDGTRPAFHWEPSRTSAPMADTLSASCHSPPFRSHPAI